jgi:hypothetical protein
MAARKRGSRKRESHRQGISGNPQRRAQQLQERVAQRHQRPPALGDPGRAEVFRELAYLLAGGAAPEPWWRESHQRILARARTITWPSRLADLETQACQVVGDEFYERLQSPETGLHPSPWLGVLAEETGRALRTALDRGADDWDPLWALLRGLVLMTPRTPANEDALRAREEFPDIKDPYEIAVAEAGRIATLLASRGLETGDASLAGGAQPAGEALVARDVYGSRLLLTAPFSYDGEARDHWYAWDVDACWLDVIVGAGVFTSAEDALREWRGAVGPAAAQATLSPCPPEMTAGLLAPSLRTGVLADMLQGHEPRVLIHEYYRLRRRARDLVGSHGADTGAPQFDAGPARAAFLDWYGARHDGEAGAPDEATEIILQEWGPGAHLDERSLHACSPHRIEMTARLIRDGYLADYANQALQLLPEWTQWCLQRSGLDGEPATRSRAAARLAASNLVDGQQDEPAAGDSEAGDSEAERGGGDEEPFRRQE